MVPADNGEVQWKYGKGIAEYNQCAVIPDGPLGIGQVFPAQEAGP